MLRHLLLRVHRSVTCVHPLGRLRGPRVHHNHQRLLSSSSFTNVSDPFLQRIRPQSRRWVDSLRFVAKGGRGGHGLAERGGQGGQGGRVSIVVASNDNRSNRRPKQRSTSNLLEVLTRYFPKDANEELSPNKRRRPNLLKAGHGGEATKFRVLGAQGKNVEMCVPQGVQVLDESGRVLANLDKPNERFVVAEGGLGGHKDNGWAGEMGQQRMVTLNLRLLADCGLIGFPNAGKSTLLKALSKASPKIANYPFTTMQPNLGHMVYEDGRRISVADLPGLIEGAHYDIGMGHTFLKHVERTSMLVFVIDINGFTLNPHVEARSAFETIVLLNRELELYNQELLGKPALCLVNKMDSEGANDKLDVLLKSLEDFENYDLTDVFKDKEMVPERKIVFDQIIPMSAKFSRKTTEYVKNALRRWMDQHEMGDKWVLNEEDFKERMKQVNKEVGPVLI